LPGAAAAGAAATAAQELEGADLALPERVAAFERGLLLRALERYRWNQRDAAHALGITYDQFRHMYRKYGLREGRE
jgi:psp operon transcriptional activator